jgi:two-component system phosphate regulon sensor histidine kinase PhoR
MTDTESIDETPRPRLPLLGRNAAADRLVRERTWLLEQRIEELEGEVRDMSRILRALGEGVLAVDRAGIVVHANPAVIGLLGMSGDGGLGSHMFIAVPHPVACELIEDVMRGESRIVRELTIEHPDGEVVLVLTGKPLRKAGADVGDEPEGAMVVVRDVTELRRLERARQDFFGNVSHELKTPVTAIRGAIETILDDAEMEPQVRTRFLDGARRHAARLGTLVTDLLALARLEGGPRNLQRGDVDLVVVASEVLAAAEAAARVRSIGLELQSGGSGDRLEELVVEGDEEAIRQAISNLVDNAIAYSPEGDAVRVVLTIEGEIVRIDVIDRGIGIPPDSLERIFERFYRVDEARSRARGGTGIGLSIVKHVAQAHGGTASVASEPGRGSTFTVRVPVSHRPRRGTQ